jgi:hypothetical protein
MLASLKLSMIPPPCVVLTWVVFAGRVAAATADAGAVVACAIARFGRTTDMTTARATATTTATLGLRWDMMFIS